MHVRASVLSEEWVSRAIGKHIQVIDYTPSLRSVDPALRSDNREPYVFAHIYLDDYEIERHIQGPRFMIIELAARGAVIVPMLAFMDQHYPWKRPANVSTDGIERSMYEEVIQWFKDLGGRVAYGSGYEPGPTARLSMQEIYALQGAGMSITELVTALTQTAALACGVPDDIGTLRVGNRADMIILDGDLRADVDALDRVTHVILDGKLAKGE